MAQAFTGRVAVVTGASSGIGAATARRLADEGFRVVLVARRTERIAELAKEIGDAASAHTVDVTDRAAVDAFAASLDRVDVLVNNAGGAFGADSVEHGDPADWLRMYEVNVLGALHVTQALLPALRASGDGTIVVLTSTAT
jgi:NADP-dependent 3-hydroxy acid dehydrogenase YdfG